MLNESVGFRIHEFGNLYYGNVTVVGGSGSIPFPSPVTGKCYHRQVTAPDGVTYTYYVQNLLKSIHDIHSAVGFEDTDDVAMFFDEVAFYMTNVSADGVYPVVIWVGPL